MRFKSILNRTNALGNKLIDILGALCLLGFILFLPFIIVFTYFASKFTYTYWWYYDFDDGAIEYLQENHFKVWNNIRNCPVNNENPFEHVYPQNNSKDISKNQLLLFQAKEGYIVTPVLIKRTGSDLFNGAWGNYFFNSSANKYVFYNYRERNDSIPEELFKLSNEELKTYNTADNFYMKNKSWTPEEEITIRFSYHPTKQENKDCKYPFEYKINIK